MSDYIDDAIAEAKIEMACTALDNNKYRCVLTSSYGEMTRDISIKEGNGAPNMGNIIYHFALNAQNIDYYDDILEWSKEECQDLNAPETIPKYKQFVANKDDLRLLLSERVYKSMMSGLEISQAIHMACPQ